MSVPDGMTTEGRPYMVLTDLWGGFTAYLTEMTEDEIEKYRAASLPVDDPSAPGGTEKPDG